MFRAPRKVATMDPDEPTVPRRRSMAATASSLVIELRTISPTHETRYRPGVAKTRPFPLTESPPRWVVRDRPKVPFSGMPEPAPSWHWATLGGTRGIPTNAHVGPAVLPNLPVGNPTAPVVGALPATGPDRPSKSPSFTSTLTEKLAELRADAVISIPCTDDAARSLAISRVFTPPPVNLTRIWVCAGFRAPRSAASITAV